MSAGLEFGLEHWRIIALVHWCIGTLGRAWLDALHSLTRRHDSLIRTDISCRIGGPRFLPTSVSYTRTPNFGVLILPNLTE